MDPLTIIALGFMLANFAYHRLKTEVPEVRKLVNVEIPIFEDGTVPPIIYGRVFVQPGVSWWGNMVQEPHEYFGQMIYKGDMLLMIGIPFYNGDTRLQGVYVGRQRLLLGFGGGPQPYDRLPNIGTLLPVANHLETPGAVGGDPTYIEFQTEFADGRPTQNFLAGAGSWTAQAWWESGIAEEDMPGHRGYATLLCRMYLGSSSVPVVGVEISTYPATVGNIGAECNPIDVLVDLISGRHAGHGQLGKLGVPIAKLDVDGSFLVARTALRAEGHGYSRVIDSGRSADDVIMEILRQTDAVMYEDQNDGLVKIKLIRADYDPAIIPQISVGNCQGLQGFAASGWTAAVNKVRVVFTDRANNYTNGSASAHNQANAVGLDGEVNEIVLQFPGVCTQALADAIAARELAARSRPLAKFTAIVDRTFIRVNPGDTVSLSWPDANISNMVFRVGRVSQGTADSNMVALDLIQDFFYVHRRAVAGDPPISFPGGGVLAA